MGKGIPPRKRLAAPDSMPAGPAPYSTLTMNFLHDFFKGMIRFSWKRLLISLFAALVAFVVHWFFLVIVNEGFYMEDGNWYNAMMIFRTRGGFDFWETTREISALLALPMVLTVLLTPISRFMQVGFGRTIRGWFQEVPRAIRYATGQFGSARTIRYYVGVFLGTGLALVFQNPIFGIAVAISLFFSASYGMTGTGVSLLYCIHSDLTPAHKKQKKLFVADNPCALMDGMSLGWLVASVPFFFLERGASGILAMLGILFAPLLVWGLVRLLKSRHATAGKAVLFLLTFLATGTLLRVMADDGGWSEAGGNFLDWLFSPGASLASLLGLSPSVASFVAIAIGFIPFVGTAVDIIGAVTGRDIITGESLSPSDRFLNLVGLGLPFVDSRLGDLFGKGKTASDLGSALDDLGGSDTGTGGSGAPSGTDGDSGSGGHGGDSGSGGHGGDSGSGAPGGSGGAPSGSKPGSQPDLPEDEEDPITPFHPERTRNP